MMNSPGVWPTMITPFTQDGGAIDLDAVQRVVDFYIDSGCDGVFAVCQSSEMFFLTQRERVLLAQTVTAAARGRVPVIASGHVSENIDQAADELAEIGGTGVAAVVLVSNRLAPEGATDAEWMRGLERLLRRLPPTLPLGIYECPHPFKHALTNAEVTHLRDLERFVFLKDTCCDADRIRQRLSILAGSNVRLYNANTATLLGSIRDGAAGYSGVMANYHPALYRRLMHLIQTQSPNAEALQALLTLAACLEARCYPTSAKYHMAQTGIDMATYTRARPMADWTSAAKAEIDQLIMLETLLADCRGDSAPR